MAKKRTNGEGSYSQRADGRWCWKMMDGYTPEGKPNTIVIYGKTQKEVKEKVKQYLRDKEDGLKIDRKLSRGIDQGRLPIHSSEAEGTLREKKARGYPAPRRGELYP